MQDRKYWLGVVSRAHVTRGVEGGFCQLCHGKAAPVRRMKPGDGLVYYSPRHEMRGGAPVQAFTAIGVIRDRAPYEVEMAPGFTPTRRDVTYWPAREALIRPLLEELDFTRGQPNWGMALRRGAFQISRADFLRIAAAMQAQGQNDALTPAPDEPSRRRQPAHAGCA